MQHFMKLRYEKKNTILLHIPIVVTNLQKDDGKKMEKIRLKDGNKKVRRWEILGKNVKTRTRRCAYSLIFAPLQYFYIV